MNADALIKSYLREVKKNTPREQNITGVAHVLYSFLLTSYAPAAPPPAITEVCLLFSRRIVETFDAAALHETTAREVLPEQRALAEDAINATLRFLQSMHFIATGDHLDIVTAGVVNLTDTFDS